VQAILFHASGMKKPFNGTLSHAKSKHVELRFLSDRHIGTRAETIARQGMRPDKGKGKSKSILRMKKQRRPTNGTMPLTRAQSQQQAKQARRRILARLCDRLSGLAVTVRGNSRRMMTMRFRPGNIGLINRRSTCQAAARCPRKKRRQLQNHPHRFRGVNSVTRYQGNALNECEGDFSVAEIGNVRLNISNGRCLR
jgi:hypothetical protein